MDYDGALHRVHHAGELRYDAVPCGINETATVMLDKAIDQLAVGGKSAQCRLFVLPHEAAIAEDIGAEYGGELTLQYPPIASRLSCRVLMDVKDCFKRHAVLRGGVGCPRAFARERRRKSLRVDPSMERALKRSRTGQGPLGMTNRKRE